MTSNSKNDEFRARDEAHEIGSILGSLNGIVSITMGLALSNTVVVLITHGRYTSIEPLSHLHLWPVLSAAAVIGAIIRFYHGNNRFMAANYAPWRSLENRGRSRAPHGGLGTDFLIIFGQSVLFAVMSFYAALRPELLLLFEMLLVFDIFWYLITALAKGAERDQKAERHQLRWIINNVAFGFLILLCCCVAALAAADRAAFTRAGVVLIICNTIVDFAISWELYFGSPLLAARQASLPDRRASERG